MIKSSKDKCLIKGNVLDIVMELMNILHNEATIESVEMMINALNVNILSSKNANPDEIKLREHLEEVLKICKLVGI